MRDYNGCLKSPVDKRDYRVSSVMDINTEILPDSFSVWIPPVQNQNQVGNCVAQTCAAIKECWHHKYHAEHKDLSVGYVYGCRENDDSGMYPRSACKFLQSTGNVFADVFENTEIGGTKIKEIVAALRPELDPIAAKRKIDKYYQLFTKEDIMSFILKHRVPVLIAGQTKDVTGEGSGRHAVTCYGWEDGGNALLFLNSWGAGWRPNGVAKCKYSAVEEAWAWTETIVRDEKEEEENMPEPTKPQVNLTDIKGRWSEVDIMDAVTDGILAGYPDSTYKPSQGLTREEIAVIHGRQKRFYEKMFEEMLKNYAVK